MEKIIEKIKNKKPLMDNEINKLLKTVCEMIRKDCKIYNPMDTDCKVCSETSKKFGIFMFSIGKYEIELLDIKKELQIPLTHYANLIFFDVNGTKKTYLVDMTYSQFFGDNIALDQFIKDNIILVSTKESFEKIKEEPFVKELRKNGFVEIDENNLIKYIDAFLKICKVQNKKEAYINVQNLLKEHNNIKKQVK